jgi:hypothetical protein
MDAFPDAKPVPERMMMWLLIAAVALVLVLRLVRRRRTLFTVLPSDSISTIHVEMTRKHTAKTKAALESATESLR